MAKNKGGSGGGNSPSGPSPIRFRKIPGQRRYLAPTGQIVSTYHVRTYRNKVYETNPEYRDVVRRQARVTGREAITERAATLKEAHLRSSFDLRKAADSGRKRSVSSVEDNDEYLDLFDELVRLRREFNNTPISNARKRNRLAGPTGPIANVLVELGLRRPEDNFPVGMSPTHTPDGATSYSDAVVAPYLRERMG